MKPTSQISDTQRGSRRDNRAWRSHQSFPLTDYNYRPTAEPQVSSSAGQPFTKAPAFHKLSSEFLGAETGRDFTADVFFFVVVSVIAAWPVVSMLIAVIRMIMNY